MDLQPGRDIARSELETCCDRSWLLSAPLWRWQHGDDGSTDLLPAERRRIDFSNIPGWQDDDHQAALATFRKSCRQLDDLSRNRTDWRVMFDAAFDEASIASPLAARQFFERFFTPFLIVKPTEGRLVTGYFEPELEGSLKSDDRHNVPVYGLPDDVVILDGSIERGDLPDSLTAVRRTPQGLAPYYMRQEIEQGALSGRGLEIVWLADPYDAYVMQVQGSGLIKFADGGTMRIGFSGKNGHPYTSVGKVLIERGALNANSATLDKVLDWLRSHPAEGQAVMWENRSYPFFRIIGDHEAADGPLGSLGAPLTRGRSLAVDPRYHQLGLPVWVDAPELEDCEGAPFRRLMIAQDSGSAIHGPVRGDIFWGSGDDAGRKAGATKHVCDFVVLIPN